MKSFSVIVAYDIERGIGKNGGLPWSIPGDMKHFKEVTSFPYEPGRMNVVIMGRKTWQSLPGRCRPLPGRQNVVISSRRDFALPEGVLLFPDFDKAIEYFCAGRADGFGEVFVIGGATIYGQALLHGACRRINVTLIDHSFCCDTFFPEIPFVFKEKERSLPFEDKGIKYSFLEYRAMP
jgi:dihydrofolate reductase